jgi:chromosome segregation ATPase
MRTELHIDKPDFYLKGAPVWYETSATEVNANQMVIAEDGGETVTNRELKKVNKKTEECIKELDATMEQLRKSVDLIHTTANATQEQLKKKTAQIKDYQAQLATAIVNLNKTMNDKQLETMVNNAERLVTALQALDSLNKHGSLDNILKALGNK